MRSLRFGCVWPYWACLVLAVAGAGATRAAEPMDTYRRADALFQQGRGQDASHLLISSSGAPAPLAGPVEEGDYELLARLAQSSARQALESARSGQRTAAIQAATAGMAISRQLMERPNASCEDVRAGIRLWLIAGAGLEQAWRELGNPEHANDAAEDLALMEQFARSVILPRCDRLPLRNVRYDARMETAEARALVRLWAYHLVRVASDNLD